MGASAMFVQVLLRQENDTTCKRTSQLGYACKEMGNAWSRNVHTHNMTNARIEECRLEHRRVAGHNVFKKRTQLNLTGWEEIVVKYEHATLWPLNTMMHFCQVVRLMLLEQTYVLFGKWLDANGNNAVDEIAARSYENILNMLRWGLRTVYVNDIHQVMTRGRKQPGSHHVFEDRDMRFDNMSLHQAKRVACAAMHDWEAQRHRLSNITDVDAVFEQLMELDIDDLIRRAELLEDDVDRAAAHAGADLAEAAAEFDGEVMNE